MAKEFTGKHDKNKQKICVGDLVVLAIPRKERRELLVIFEVVKNHKIYEIIYSEKFSHNTMSDGSLQYGQKLNFQVYKVVGNIETGIDENLLV